MTRAKEMRDLPLAIDVDSSGDVGIGTNNPGAKLDLRGNLRLDSGGSTSRSIYFRNQDTSATGGGQIRSDQYLSLWAGNGGGTPTQYLTIKTGGNVGIGTNSPGAKLQVDDGSGRNLQIAPSGSGIDIISTTNPMRLITSDASDMIFYTNGTSNERMRLDASYPYLGIGTQDPSYALDISGDNFSKSSIRLTRTDTGTNNDAGIYFQNNAGANDDTGLGGIWFVNTLDNNAYGMIRCRTDDSSGTSAKLEFITSTSTVGNATDPRMLIDSTGNVGIGTTNPSKKLHVSTATSYDGILVSNSHASSAARLQLNNNDSKSLQIDVGGSTQSTYGPYIANTVAIVANSAPLNIGTDSANKVAFYTNLNERMWIDSNGDTSIVASQNYVGGAPGGGTSRFSVMNATSGKWVAQMRSDNTGAHGLFVRAGNTASTYTAHFTGYDEANVHMSIDGLGRVTTPNQPMFDAARPAASSASSNLTGWQATYVNIGNHFNASNGRFTAPVAGTYLFYGTGIKNGSSTTTMRYYLVKNSASGYIHGSRHLRLDGGNVNTYGDNAVMTWMVTLAANDWVQAKINGGTVYTATYEYTIFGGYLLG